MKLKLNVKDLMDMLVFERYREFMVTYDIDRRNLRRIRQALKNGRWIVAMDLMSK